MPPKKGAGKAKAPKNETEEERAARLEMEALAGEERQRREQEMARVALRERQLREQKYAHINGIKIHNQWRKIMRMAKVEELRKQIEVLSQNHEREVDRQDAIIQLLDRDLEEAEEQYALTVRSHMMVVERLLDLQYQRMKALEAQFNADLQALQDEFDTERAEIINSHVRKRKDMADMAAAMEREFAEAEAEARQEFESQREEIRNKNSEELNVQKLSLETAIEELEQKYENALTDYKNQTDHRLASFKSLSAKDEEDAMTIEQRMKKLVHLQEALQQWRLKISSNGKEWEERNKALRAEKEIMTRHYSQLKASMDQSREQQAERLRALSVASARLMESLRAKLARGESILKLAELCRKYETQGEQVLPFYSSSEVAQLQAMSAEGVASSSGEPISLPPALHSRGVDPVTGKEVEEHEYLSRFFVRYNRVLLDQTAIDRERQRLQEQNEQLRGRLKQYLDGLSVSDDVINDPANPLLIVNQRLQLKLAAQQQAKQAKQKGSAAQPVLVLVNSTSHAP